MAGRGRGGKQLLLQTLQRLKVEEEQKPQEESIPSQPTPQPTAQLAPRPMPRPFRRPIRRPSPQPSPPPTREEPESTSESGTSTPASGQSDASQPPSEEQSAASDTDSHGSGNDSPETRSPRRPDSPDRELKIRGKFRRFLVKKTPPDTPRSQSPNPSESGDSTSAAQTEASSDQSSVQSGESSPASAGSRSPVPSVASSSESTSSSVPSALKPIENKVVGQDGEKIKVAVNYMKMSIKSKKIIHLYAVFFEPQIDSISLRRKVLNSSEVKQGIGNVFNFTGTNLFLPIRLEEDPLIIAAPHPTTGSSVIVTIQHVKVPPTDELVNFYNNLFNKVMRAMKLVELTNHHYNPNAKIDVPNHKLEVWPGYICAIQDYDGGLMLNVDTAHRVLRKKTARDMLHELFQDDPQRFAERARKLLVGAVVLTRYNNRAYRVDDIDFSRTPTDTFQLKEGQDITFIEYFRQQWGTTINDTRQPLLLHRPKPRRNQTEESPLICLVPELSYLTGLSDDIRADHRVMKDLATHTKISPEVKYRRLVEFIRQANTDPGAKEVLVDWGIEIEPKPFETYARRFGAEKMTFGNGVEISAGDKAEWGMKIKDVSILASKPIQRWYFIYNARDRPKAEEFLKMLQLVSRKLGFAFDNPRKTELRDDNTNSYRQSLKEVDKQAQLVVIMTPGSSQREDRYAAIKQMCCVDLGIPSQVVRVSTLTPNKFRSVCVNIALQIACKQGGQLWSVSMPLVGAMYMGLDSYHDPSNKARSVVGVVSSLNKNATQWYSRCYFQSRREEIVNSLGAAMTAALRKYIEVNGAPPGRIFIYRDGVGDGDLPTVRDYEIPQMEEAITTVLMGKENVARPLITLVVVQKRVNVKMMQLTSRGMFNPPPGSVIDHTVTRRQFYDFYLISQHVHQGTVTPTHYISLIDQCNLGPDKLQKLTYKMTHLYYNFPATIRVPAPCQYAHKLAYLMGQFVKNKPNEVLYDKLFYL